jgi:isopentenyl diphosphate isomerase/L-lactate dehydrogenase-like FMN-dependent dehydrogenase
MAGPFLKAADRSMEAVTDEIEATKAELRAAMFVAGARDLAALREPGRLLEV